MATSSTYYLNAPSLGSATAVFTNAALTVCAPNGFYSDGFISRELVDCVLLPQQICPSCTIPCDESITADGLQGIYYLNAQLGTATGAIIIRFNPINIPDGIRAIFNSVVYNGVSSPVYGWLQGTAGLATYIGLQSADCGIVAGSPYTLDEFQYDGTNFAALGTDASVSILAGQIELTELAPGNTLMVIPKITASPSILNLEFIGPCSETEFIISVDCPTALTAFSSSTVSATSELACEKDFLETYYVAHVNGSSGTLGLYDLVFSDVNGQFKLGAGFYKTNDAGANNWYQVDANGAIVLFGTCLVPIPCGDAIEGDGGEGVYYIESNIGTGTGAIIVTFNPQGIADGILATYNSVNYNGVSSPSFGWLQGTAGLPTFIGNTDCSIVAGSPHDDVAEFEYNGTTFAPLGTDIDVTVLAGQMQLTASAPGLCVMVIPKPTASPASLEISIIGVCSTTLFDIDINCPAPLTSFASSLNNFDSSTACVNAIDQTFYVAHVNGAAGVLGLYDLVFSDVNGQFKLSTGYYKTTAAGANNWYRVDSNGAIIQFGTCP
jgi:hypothetical protein